MEDGVEGASTLLPCRSCLPKPPCTCITLAFTHPWRPQVFVGGMPYHYDEEGVREYWSYCGDIESLDLMTFPDSGRFRGIAFITFASQEGHDSALTCDGEQCEGQTLKVGGAGAWGSAREGVRSARDGCAGALGGTAVWPPSAG